MSEIRKSSPKLQAFFSRLKVEALPVIKRATVLLLKFPKDKPVPDRSGVLLRIAQEHFIISCLHNLQKLLAKNVPLCMALPGVETPFVHLIDATFHGTETDHRDIVAIHLSPRAAAELRAAGCVPIEMADISRGDPVQPGLFLLFGYPQEWFDFEPGKLAHPPLIFLAGLYEPSAALIADLASDVRYGMAYNPGFHGLFTMTSNARRTSDWLEIPLPDYNGMKGISGCGVWRLCDATPEAITKWTVDQCKLVAIARAARLRVAGDNKDPIRFISDAAQEASGGELQRSLSETAEALSSNWTCREFAESQNWSAGISGYVNQTVPAALFCWASSPNDLRQCVENAISLGGDSDSVGAIVGAVCGSNLGAAAVPDDWLCRLAEWPRSAEWMGRLATALATMGNESSPPPPMRWAATLPRNALVGSMVIALGFRRLLPPY